jgi:hypothetical protein
VARPSSVDPSTDEPQHVLSELVGRAVVHGEHAARDFIRDFPPSAIMDALSEQPQVRAQLLALTTGIKREIALKKSAQLAAEDLQIALDEGVTDAEAVTQALTRCLGTPNRSSKPPMQMAMSATLKTGQ